MILDEKVIYLEYFALRYKENFTLSALKKIHFHEFLNKIQMKGIYSHRSKLGGKIWLATSALTFSHFLGNFLLPVLPQPCPPLQLVVGEFLTSLWPREYHQYDLFVACNRPGPTIGVSVAALTTEIDVLFVHFSYYCRLSSHFLALVTSFQRDGLLDFLPPPRPTFQDRCQPLSWPKLFSASNFPSFLPFFGQLAATLCRAPLPSPSPCLVAIFRNENLGLFSDVCPIIRVIVPDFVCVRLPTNPCLGLAKVLIDP